MKETMTVNGKEYTLLKLLGKGKGGYSWLAEADDGRTVTLKQIHHEPCDYYQFGDKLAAELADYRRMWTTNATTTWTNGTLKTGASNTGQKRRNFSSTLQSIR